MPNYHLPSTAQPVLNRLSPSCTPQQRNYTRKMKTKNLIHRECGRLTSALVVVVHARSIRVLGDVNRNPSSVRLKSTLVGIKEGSPVYLTGSAGAIDVDGNGRGAGHGCGEAGGNSNLCTDCIPCTCTDTGACRDGKGLRFCLGDCVGAVVGDLGDKHRGSRHVDVVRRDDI
jgi:hypothetical protein